MYTENKCHVVQYQGLPSFQGRKPATLTYFFLLRDGPGGAPFDPSDFPSLGGGAGGALGGSGRNNYGKLLTNIRFTNMWFLSVGMVKQPADHSSEFQMSNEDFPALPGAPAAEPGSSNSILESVKLPTAGLTPEQVNIKLK